jgi:hypothetical protein
MEALQLAWIAYEGLKLLIILIAGGAALAKPVESARICYQELAPPEGVAVCPRDFTRFTLPAADDHLMVRR